MCSICPADRTSLPLVGQPLSYSAVLQAPRPVCSSIQVPAVSVSAPLVHPVESLQGSVVAPLIGDLGSKGYVGKLAPSYLQALKILEKSAPKNKFSGRNCEMNFERFMVRMERAMDAEGVTDELRVEHIDNWFSGQALRIIQSKKDNDVFVNATTTLESIKVVLKKKYVEKFDAEGMLKKLAKGKPIAKCSLEEVRALIVDLECQFDLAKGKGEAAIFERKSIYRDILVARLPHLITEWNKEFGGDRKEWTLEAFTGFIESATKVEEEELLYRKGESHESGSVIPRSVAYNPFASGHPDASANGRDNYVHSRPRSPPRGLLGFCFYCSKEHQLGNCEEFKALGLDARVDFCRSRRVCYKCLNNVYHNFSSCEFKSRCETCLASSHHTLLHGMRRFHSLPGSSTLPKSDS
jgi:hypothetical protein